MKSTKVQTLGADRMPDLRCAFTKRVFCECACERKFVHYPAVGFNRYINRNCRSIMIIYLLVHNIVRSAHRTSLNNPIALSALPYAIIIASAKYNPLKCLQSYKYSKSSEMLTMS